MRDKRYFFIGITKSKTAISESFVDLIASAPVDSVIFYGAGSDAAEFPMEVEKIQVPIGRRAAFFVFFSLMAELIKSAWKFRHDDRILIAYSTLPINWLIFIILQPRKFYIWSHDPRPHSGANFYNSKIQPLDSKFCLKYLGANVLCGSLNVKGILEKMRIKGDIRSITFPYISALVDADVGLASESLEKPIDLIFFGRMEEYKGIEILIDALKLMGSNSIDKPYRVVFAGHGPLLEYVKQQKFDKPIDLDVIERPSNSVLKSLLMRSKFCCLPYLDGTGSQVMQSALALGCRILCSDLSLFKEIAACVNPGAVDFFPNGNSEMLANLILAKSQVDDEETDRQSRTMHARRVFSPNAWSEKVALIYV